MKKILFSFVTVLMGIMLFSSCANDDQVGVDKYITYQENFQKTLGNIHPGQNFNTQKTVTIQSTTGKQGNYTLKVYDGKPGRKSTSLIGKFENLNGNAVTPVKVDVSKSLKNIYCVADDGTTSRQATVKVNPKGDLYPSFDDNPIRIPIDEIENVNDVTLAFEDLGSTYDFDFNDVVITVHYVSGLGRATVTLQALGGVLPVKLSYVSRIADYSQELFEGKELHEAMGYDVNTMINTNWVTKNGIIGVDNVEPITDEIDVTGDFSIGEDGAPFVIIVNGKEGQRQITADTKAGVTPQVLVLGKFYDEQGNSKSWIWPKEMSAINDAYPTINNWLQNDPNDMSFIGNPDENQIYDGFNPNQGGEDGIVAVDLGLPSGTLWANMNVEASSPEEYGGYYAWGEIEEQWTDEIPSYSNISYIGPADSFTQPTSIAGSEYDVAHMLWGDGWMMPTEEQFIELFENTTYSWTSINGVYGAKFTADNGNSIFLPAAGRYQNDNLASDGTYGYYWADYYDPDNLPQPSWELFGEDGINVERGGMVTAYYKGYSVRPVKAGTPNPVTFKAIDLGLTSGTKWANMNLGANSPEEAGYYVQWGDLTGWDAEDIDDYGLTFEKEAYKWYEEGEIYDIGSNISGNEQYDIATKNLKDKWALPTAEQCEELMDECTFTWAKINGVLGGKFTGPNGKSIFIPAAGTGIVREPDSAGNWTALIWTGTNSEYDSNNWYATSFVFYVNEDGSKDSPCLNSQQRRWNSLSVRPVFK